MRGYLGFVPNIPTRGGETDRQRVKADHQVGGSIYSGASGVSTAWLVEIEKTGRPLKPWPFKE